VLLVDFTGLAASTWHDHSGVTFTASDLTTWFLEALLQTIDTLASVASLLPDVTRWNQSTVDFTWAFRRFNHVFTVTE
jgi:hypothetical protein